MGGWIIDYCTPADASDDALRIYRPLLVGLSFDALTLALLVPSTIVRVLILVPILIEAGQQFDSSKAKIGLFLGPIISTYYGGSGILTAALPNIVITGIVGSTAGITITWTEWFILIFPVMGLGRTLLVVGVIYLLYHPSSESNAQRVEEPPSLETGVERRMLIFLFIGSVVWANDFLHGLDPIFDALLVVILALFPKIGVMEFRKIDDAVDFSILFFLGAVFAIGEGLSQTGIADAIAEALLKVIPADAPLPVVLSPCLV